MAKNVERILNKLQSLCEEKAVDCATDFAQHENWLLSTFKTSALQKLTRPKVELACPTSTKKQKTSEAPMQPAPEYAETADMQTDSIEELAPQEPKPAPVAAPDPDAAAKLAAAMAAAMGNDAVDQASTATGRTSQKTTDDQPSEVRQMDTASATRTPVAANVKPDKDPLISPDSPQEKKPTASVRASQPTSQANPVPAASERQTVPTPHRTLSATEQLSRLRQRLAGIKTGSTPSQPANPGGSKLHSTEKAALIHPAPVEEEAAEPAPVEAAAQQAVGTATTASVSRSVASTSAAQTHTAIEQGPGMVKHDDSSQKRDLDQVEHTDSMPKKTKLDGSTQQVPGSPAPATDLVQSVDTNSGTDRLAVDNSMLSAASQRQDTESEQQKKAAPALALNMAVEDKLAMAAARRQQMEVDQATERTKDNEPVASSSTSGTDQSKKRSHPEDLDGGQKRAKAPSTTSAGTENMTVGTDKVLMPPPPPSASKKTPLKTPSSSYNSTANSYATEMKPTASSIATPAAACTKGSTSSASDSGSANSSQPQPASASAGAAEGGAENKKPKKVPEWAQGAKLQESLRGEQMYRDPDEIFGPIQMTCNLQEIFNSNKSKYKKRSSSGNWLPDRVSYKEEAAYKRSAGYR